MIKDMVITPKELEPRSERSTQEGYYFNSLSHHEKVSAIVNNVGLKLKRKISNAGRLSIETTNHFPNKLKWLIIKKQFNKNSKILTIELSNEE